MGMMLRRYHEGQGPAETPAVADAFNPDDFTVAEVVEYLTQADDEDRIRVLDAEAAGKNRKGIVEWEPPQAPTEDPEQS